MAETREITCINCPIGCRLTVELEQGSVLSVSGNTCKRGETYGIAECTAPKRMVTGLVCSRTGGMPLSVRTAEAIPKEKVFDCLSRIHSLRFTPPVSVGDVLIENVCETGVDVIATKTIK